MTKKMGAEELGALREAAERATPGPWCYEQCGEKVDAPVVGIAYRADDFNCQNPLSGWLQDFDQDGKEVEYYREQIAAEISSCDGCSASANAVHIALANPSTVLRLLDQLQASNALVERLTSSLEVCRQTIKDQATVLADPTMPVLTADLRDWLREDAEATYACAEDLQERRQAHALGMLSEWQDAAALRRTALSGD